CCDEALALFEFHTVAEFTADFFQMHPEYQPSGEQTVRLLRRDVQAAFDGEIVSRKVALASKDGKLLQIRLEMLKMTDEAVICFFNEMFAPAQTPASAADLQDLQTNHMLEFLEHAPSTIFIIDMMGNIIYSNQHAMTSFGIKSKEAFASQFFSRFSKRFQSNLLAKDFMTIHIGKAMLQGVVRFAWDVKRDYHESSGSIRLVRVQYKGTLACIAYLTEFGLDKDSYFDEPLENTLLDDKMWSVLDPMPFVWYFMDLEGNLLDCNMAAVHLFSAQSKRDLVEKWGEVDPEIQSCGTLSEEIVAQNIEAVMNENKIVFEWDHLDLEGQLIPTEITLVRVGIKNRFILSAFVRDLRDQRALEFQRSLDEARLQAVLENVPSAIHLWGMGGALLYCNDKMVDDFGPGSSKEYRQKFLKTQVLNILTDVVKKGAPKSIEAEVKNNQGENVPVERSFFRINYGGNFAVLEFCTDLRLQRAKEVQMEKEKERFKLFFNTVPAVCSLWNENREITMCNYATARLFGLNDPQEFIDYPTRFSPKYQPCGTSSKQKIMAYIEAAFAAGYAEFDWMHLIPKTGELVPCVVSLTRSELGGKPTLIGLTLDQRVHFAKESLLKTEGKRFKQFFDAVPAACEFWDENGELMMCNLAAARLVGLSTPQEFIDKYREITPETQPCGTNSAEKGKAYIDAAFEHGHAEFPWTHLMPETGEQIPTRVTLTRTEFEGRPGLIALTLDLREDVAKEEMLKKDNQRFRRFFDAAPAVCTFWNENRELHMCNEYTANLFGLSSPQEYLERFAELSTEYQPCGTLSRLKAMKLVEEAFSTGFVEFDWMHYRPDTDEEIPTFVTLTLTELEGRPGLMGFAIDQRENQKIEKLLRHERKRFEMLFNIMPAVCTFWSDERKLTMANDNAAKLFGLSDKQEYLDRFAELSPPMQPCGTPSFEKAMSYVEEAFSSGHSTFDWMHQKPSGEQIPAVVSLTLIEIDSKPALIGFTQDMRERVEIGTELERIDVILKNLPMAAHVWDKEHNLLYVNDFMMKLYGYTDEKEYKWDLFKVYPDAQPDGMNSIESSNYHIDIAFEKGYHKIEWVAAAEDGSPLPLECTLIRINYGGVDAVLEFCRDLRKEHEARTLGKEATEKLRLLLDFLPVPMVILDLKLNIIDCNQASVRLYEFYNKEEYIENFINTWPVYQPDGTPTDILFGSILEKSVSFGDQSFECVLNTKYGVGIPMKVSVIPTELGRQKVLLIAGEDLRPRDAVVREQELLKERLQAMIDASPNCCLIIERSGFVTDCNSVAF
ncbi:MAG: PAS domain-containing protein, partial [Defluviitaleaceae bacterium]|nr:PAS domain-containing protein [Defluviitaleaceae bacterium]